MRVLGNLVSLSILTAALAPFSAHAETILLACTWERNSEMKPPPQRFSLVVDYTARMVKWGSGAIGNEGLSLANISSNTIKWSFYSSLGDERRVSLDRITGEWEMRIYSRGHVFSSNGGQCQLAERQF
jgi:hypothetical protein